MDADIVEAQKQEPVAFAVVALAPVPIAWLLVYGLVALGGWIPTASSHRPERGASAFPLGAPARVVGVGTHLNGQDSQLDLRRLSAPLSLSERYHI